MLQLALSRHSRVAIPPETAFFTMLKRSRRGQRRHWHCIENDLGIQVDPPSHRIVPGEHAGEHFWRIGRAYLDRLGQPGVTHFGEKSPQHQRRVPAILKTFPEAKLVLIYRDGRDVALSLTKLSWMPKNLYVNFFVWLHYYRIQRCLLQQQTQRIYCVRYEDLVHDPEAELKPLLDFLGLNYEPQVAVGSGNRDGVPNFEMSYKGRALEPISKSRIGIWRRELSHKEITRLERWGGRALRDLHYECTTDCTKRLPPWHYPALYSRIGFELTIRTAQRKLDEWFGTSLYRPNRIARDFSGHGASCAD